MHDFLLKEISNTDICKELEDIGFDKSYIKKAVSKFEYKNIKIYNITPAQANIIKQTALSLGADCATHREVITGKAETSNCILGGSISQLEKISQKLLQQPFGLKELSGEILEYLNQKQNNRTKIVGILNLTKDSFSDGGKYYEFDDAITQLHTLINDGADIVDIGAESTRPYSLPIEPKEQLEKIIPVLEYINNNKISTQISIDTRSSEVARICLDMGVSIINDVSGLEYDKNMADVIAQYVNAKVIIQHSLGTPENMQNSPQYNNLIDDIYINLKEKTEFALSKGIKSINIIIDPGIGFGKTKEQNLQIIKCWKDFKTLGYPIMLGVSRKSFMGLKNETNERKDIQTLGINSILMNEKIDYIRVHNVKLHKEFQDLMG